MPPPAAAPTAAPTAPLAPSPPPGQPVGPRTQALIVGGLLAAFFSFLAWGRVQATPGLWGAFVVCGVGLTGWIGWLWLRARRTGQRLTVEWTPRRHHIVQLGVQGSIFVYWGWHWAPVGAQVPLVLAQVVFAYLFDLALSWQRYGNFRFGFGPWPVIGSTNLFLWFRDPLFGAQFAMVASMYLAREFLKWERQGKRVHIFNPSAFGLTLAATALIALSAVHLSWGELISESLGYGELSYEQMFLAAAVSQLFFGVTVVPISAALTLVGLGYLYFAVTGVWFFVDTSIPIAVFLSLNLLITDPVSSPYSQGGKALFGVLYAVGVMALYVGLRLIEAAPTDTDPGLTAAFFDKLLHVPLLNLMARGLDRVGPKIPIERLTGRLTGLAQRAVHVGAWAGVFVAIRPSLIDHPGSSAEFWRTACADQRPFACDNLLRTVATPCARGIPRACFDLGILYDEGQALPRDVTLARGLWGRNCQAEHAPSCVKWGEHIMADASADPAVAFGAFQQACTLSEPRGCTLLGMLIASGRLPGLDPSTAREHLQTGCTLGDGLGCSALGSALLQVPDPQAAFTQFERACELDYLIGCSQTADMHRMLRFPRYAEAATLYRKACDGDVAAACLSLAEQVAAGQGVTADAAEAASLRAKACRLGEAAACAAP